MECILSGALVGNENRSPGTMSRVAAPFMSRYSMNNGSPAGRVSGAAPALIFLWAEKLH